MDADYPDQVLLATRPRLREDAVWLPLRGGVVFRTHAQSFRLVGQPLFTLAETLLPLTDGLRLASEILDSCPSDRRAHLVSLLRLLLQRGILVDEPPATVSDARVKAAFQEQIAFVRHLTGHDAAFVRFREARVLLAGEGRPFQSCALTLLRSGLRRVTLLPVDRAGGLLEPIGAAARRLRDAGIEAGVDVIDTAGRACPPMDGYDFVAYVGTAVRTNALVLLNRECGRARRSLLVGLALGRQTIAGPLIDGIVSGCWMCGFVRLGPDLLDAAALPDFLRPAHAERARLDASGEDVRELERLLGREMAFETFKYLAGDLRPQTREHVVVSSVDGPIDGAVEGAGSFTTRCVPHPLCGCMRFCAEIGEPPGAGAPAEAAAAAPVSVQTPS